MWSQKALADDQKYARETVEHVAAGTAAEWVVERYSDEIVVSRYMQTIGAALGESGKAMRTYPDLLRGLDET